MGGAQLYDAFVHFAFKEEVTMGFPFPPKKPSTFSPAPFNFPDADFCLRRPPPGPLPRPRQGHPTVGVPEQHAQKQVWQKYGTLFTIQH